MEYLPEISHVSKVIRDTAKHAMQELTNESALAKIAKEAIARPVDYMRSAEFTAILRLLDVTPGMRILDMSSPQWFSIYLAKTFPAARIEYCNILDSEIEPYKRLCQLLGIGNIRYHKEDVRDMRFDSDRYDKVISISVIEHVYPEQGGDYSALKEIKRVLKPGGELLLTVPFKQSRNIIYIDGEVYERGAKERNFYAREYDKEMFAQLIEKSGYTTKNTWSICEKKGLLSIDYWTWGPGKTVPLTKYIFKSLRLVERLSNRSVDELLARRYLRISSNNCERLVNIAAVLTTDK